MTATVIVWFTHIITALFAPHRPLILFRHLPCRARQSEEKWVQCEMNKTVMMCVNHTVWITNIVTRPRPAHRGLQGVARAAVRYLRSCKERKRAWARAW